MKRIHLLKTELQRSGLADLLAAMANLRLRAGWLDWRPHAEPETLSNEGTLLDMATAPVLRAVAVESRRVTSIKPMVGDAVFRDVLRAHFRGCAVVLVRVVPGASEPDELESAPELEVADGKYGVAVVDDGPAKRFSWTAEELAERLRRPRPFSGGD